MPSAPNRAETPDSDGERRSLVRRALALPMRVIAVARQKPLIFTVLLLGSTIILASGSSVVYYLATHSPASDRNVTIEAALALLDKGEYDKARQMAIRLRRKTDGGYRQLGHSLFVQGAVLANEAADLGHERERETLNLVAARYLEEARDRGFPPGRERQGLYLLATSLFNAAHYAESLPALHEASDRFSDRAFELARLLSTAYLRDSVPNLQQALHYNLVWLEDPALPQSMRDEAELQLAEIYLDLHDAAKCRETLAKISDDSPARDQALLTLARLNLQEGDQLLTDAGKGRDEAKNKFNQAVQLLETAQSKDILGVTTRQARYLLGICYQKLGDLRAATKFFERTRHMHYGTPEALAATLAEAEIAQQQKRQGIALTLYLKVLEEAGVVSVYQNRWLPLSKLQGRLLAGQQQFVLDHEFQSALTLADAFSPLLPDDQVAAAKAESHEIWAEHLLEDAHGMGNTRAALTRAEARRQYRLAAAQYHKLAERRFATAEYPTDLWKSGTCFLLGQNYELAIRMLREHLNDVPHKQAPQGLVSLGECLLALGQNKSALNVLTDCIEQFPMHPASYRARLLASAAHRELGQLHEAEALLIDNLHNSSLDPRSRHWQDSLVAYGKLLFQEALMLELDSRRLTPSADRPLEEIIPEDRQIGLKELQESHDLFQQAIDTLGEAVLREENAARDENRESDTSEARYFIAEANRHSANLPKRSLEIEPTQTRRNALSQQIRGYLKEAAKAHHELQDLLAKKQNVTDLSAIEQRILRNTYFAYADTLFALEEYDQAIAAYAAATNRYQHEPEALEALVQIANCYRRLGAPAEARGTLLQAKSVLSRIRPDADFTKTTRYDRKDWEQLINWLTQL